MSMKFIRRMANKLFRACDCKGVSSNHHTKSAKEESTVSAKEENQNHQEVSYNLHHKLALENTTATEEEQSHYDHTHGKALIYIFF